MNYNISSLPTATMPLSWQIAIGVILFVIVLRSMRNHSMGYTIAVMIAVAAPLYIHSFGYMALALLVAAGIALVTHCSRNDSPTTRS